MDKKRTAISATEKLAQDMDIHSAASATQRVRDEAGASYRSLQDAIEGGSLGDALRIQRALSDLSLASSLSDRMRLATALPNLYELTGAREAAAMMAESREAILEAARIPDISAWAGAAVKDITSVSRALSAMSASMFVFDRSVLEKLLSPVVRTNVEAALANPGVGDLSRMMDAMTALPSLREIVAAPALPRAGDLYKGATFEADLNDFSIRINTALAAAKAARDIFLMENEGQENSKTLGLTFDQKLNLFNTFFAVITFFIMLTMQLQEKAYEPEGLAENTKALQDMSRAFDKVTEALVRQLDHEGGDAPSEETQELLDTCAEISSSLEKKLKMPRDLTNDMKCPKGQ